MKLKGTFVFNLEPLGPFKFVSKPYVLSFTPVIIPQTERKLVAWWKFDEAEGNNAGDSSGNELTGTLTGNPQWQPTAGKNGGALAFDGIDDYIECGRDEGLNISGGLTIAAWIKLAKSTIDQKVASNQDNITGGYKLSIFSGKAELEVRDSDNLLRNNRFVDGGTILETGVWYHIVGTYSQGDSIKTYVNANLDREQETLTVLAPSTGPLKIGCEPFNGGCLFNGLMDDLQIYNYPLSENEVAALYAGKELPSTTPGILAVSGEKTSTGNYLILALVVVIIATVAAGLAIRKQKLTT
jgi:hypothetical protein